MEDLFKKVFYTGVGLVSTTSETIQKGMDDLVKKGKISEEEGEKVVSNFEKTVTEKRGEFEAIVTNAVGVAMAKLNLPSAEVISRLEKRIKSLEIKVGLLTKEVDEKPAKKTTRGVKKTTRRKVTA